MKKIWALFSIIGSMLPLHGMQLQETAVPSLHALSLKSVAEKKVSQAFEQEFEQSNYDFATAKTYVDEVLSIVSDGVSDAHEKRIKELFCEKYGGFYLHKKLRRHRFDSLKSLAFSPDGRKLASGSDDKTVRIWNMATGAPEQRFLISHEDWARSVAFLPDGNKLASSDGKTVKIWDMATGACEQVSDGNEDLVDSIASLPLRSKLASGYLHEQILRGHGSEVSSVAFSPDGSKFAAGYRDTTVIIWQKQNFDQILFKQALVKAASEENIEALKWLLFDAKVSVIGRLFEKEELEVLKEDIISNHSIERKDLAVSFYSGMMRCCKNVFSKVAGVIRLKSSSDQSLSKGRWWHFNSVRRGIGSIAIKFAAIMRRLWGQ